MAVVIIMVVMAVMVKVMMVMMMNLLPIERQNFVLPKLLIQGDGICTFSPFPHNGNDNWDHYKMSRNKVNVALRRAKCAYYRSKIASLNNNPKRAWKTINNLLGRSCNDTVINELKINNDSITSPEEEMADAFNEYFVQIGSNLAR